MRVQGDHGANAADDEAEQQAEAVQPKGERKAQALDPADLLRCDRVVLESTEQDVASAGAYLHERDREGRQQRDPAGPGPALGTRQVEEQAAYQQETDGRRKHGYAT